MTRSDRDEIRKKKDYLKKAYWLSRKIDMLIAEYEDADQRRLRVKAIDYSAATVSGSGSGDALTNALIVLEKIRTDISNLIGQYEIKVVSVKDCIRTVEDKTEQEVLYRRYILFERWEQIAVAMNYSIQHIYYLHGEALGKVKIDNTSE